ncbi:hypothetical protein [Microscilla marina]|nr:hypothetical protein [Microscilla marina]
MAQIFPGIKGNVLPIRNLSFFKFDNNDFQFVKIANVFEENIKVHKTWSLLEDQVVSFVIEDGVKYCYTNFFKIELEQALATYEVTFPEKGNMTTKDKEKLTNRVEEIVESWANYYLGLVTKYELDNRMYDILVSYFRQRVRWEVKQECWWRRAYFYHHADEL